MCRSWVFGLIFRLPICKPAPLKRATPNRKHGNHVFCVVKAMVWDTRRMPNNAVSSGPPATRAMGQDDCGYSNVPQTSKYFWLHFCC